MPQRMILGSETASTLSSRGIYKFPVEQTKGAMYEDAQCCSYDMGSCPWSNLPDDDWAFQDGKSWVIGELFGQVSITSASRLLMTMFGPRAVLISEFAIWQDFPKIDIIFIAAGGIPTRRRCISCLIGIGKDEKGR